MEGEAWEVRQRWKEQEKQTKIAAAETSAQADLKAFPSLCLNVFHLYAKEKNKTKPEDRASDGYPPAKQEGVGSLSLKLASFKCFLSPD